MGSRPRLLNLFVLFLALVSIQSPASARTRQAPNIVFILVDDQRYDAMGFLNPWLKTPNIDSIAADGAYFRNAFVTTSLCSPSRASILTGKYMHDHGVVDNNEPVRPGTLFFPQLLQAAGYQTAFIGKWHMGASGDSPQPGFDHWVSFKGQGEYNPVNAAGKKQTLNVDGTRVDRQTYITDELTDYAIKWLNQRNGKQPFFLYLSHKAVHDNFEPAQRHRDLYRGDALPVPAEARERRVAEGVPLWVQNQRNSWHGVDFPYHSTLDLGEYMRRYYATLAGVDESVGRIRGWLEDNGYGDNTIIIYMSDNGFLFGEHGLIDKRNAYEESMRVPLLMSAPGLISPGTVVDAMSANIDIAPTILGLAGIAAPKDFAGMDLLPFATGKVAASDGRQKLLYEYYWEYNYPHTPTTFALRTPQYKFIQYHGVWDTEELFDLAADPREQNNLIADPSLAAVKIDMRRQLFAMLRNGDGKYVVPYTMKVNEGAVLRNIDGAPPATFPERWMRDDSPPDAHCHFTPDTEEKLRRVPPDCSGKPSDH